MWRSLLELFSFYHNSLLSLQTNIEALPCVLGDDMVGLLVITAIIQAWPLSKSDVIVTEDSS